MTTTTEQAALRQMIDGYRISKIICVAAELGLADQLASGPKHYAELAAASGTNAQALYRLLRALSSAGVFEQIGEQRFALNSRGALLRKDAPASLRAWAIFSSRMYRSWAELDHSIATGGTAFDHLHGMNVWTYREQHQDEGRVFNDAMSAHVAFVAQAIATAYDFSRFATIVDVGGGQGVLLAAILQANPRVRGILFDVPGAIREARSLFEPAGLAARCRLAEGSFFESVPGDGDAYVLSRVLHDWNDDQVSKILKTMRRSMNDKATLLIVERALEQQNPALDATLSDLNMMVQNGGRERTTAEFEELLTTGSFKLVRRIPGPLPFQILEAVAV